MLTIRIVAGVSSILALSPGLVIGGRGREKEGLVSTACACACMHYVFRIFYHKSVRRSSGQLVFVYGEARRKKYPDSHVFNIAPAHVIEQALAHTACALYGNAIATIKVNVGRFCGNSLSGALLQG